MIAGLPRCLISAPAQRMAKRRQRRLPKRRLQSNFGLKPQPRMTCPSPNLDTGQSNTRRRDALSENGNPTLETLTSVLGALGLELTVQKKAA
jgi:hypothetical protein